MCNFKTYAFVNHNNKQVSFGIQAMQNTFKPNRYNAAPHRHNFYTILLIKKGQGTHLIDFNTYTLGQHQVFFIAPGQVHQLIEKAPTNGYAITFSSGFLDLSGIDLSFFEAINLFNTYGNSPPLKLANKTFDLLENYAKEMLTYFKTPNNYAPIALGALLQLFLLRCHDQCDLKKLDTQTQESGANLLKAYKELINKNFKIWHQTRLYANALFITPDHLNRVVKSLTGQTAKQHLQSKLITEAKRLLFYTNQSLKEIAFTLGFKEPNNFSAYFKNCTGMSPKQFKAQGLTS